MKTVLLRRSALGDVVLLGAVAAAVPGGVDVLTAPQYCDLVRRMRGVNAVHKWGGPVPAGRVIDLQGSLRSRRIAAATRIDKRSIRRRLRLVSSKFAPRPSVVELYAEAVGVTPVGPPWIDGTLHRDALSLAPGAAWAPKRFSWRRLAAVGRQWEGPVFVLGGPQEETLVARVAAEIPGAIGIAEKGFENTIAALHRTKVAVSGDSGLMHLAGACGASVVGLFGPTHPSDGFWVYPGTVVQRSDVTCRPCALHRVQGCYRGHHRCMDLSVDRVLREVMACAG